MNLSLFSTVHFPRSIFKPDRKIHHWFVSPLFQWSDAFFTAQIHLPSFPQTCKVYCLLRLGDKTLKCVKLQGSDQPLKTTIEINETAINILYSDAKLEVIVTGQDCTIDYQIEFIPFYILHSSIIGYPPPENHSGFNTLPRKDLPYNFYVYLKSRVPYALSEMKRSKMALKMIEELYNQKLKQASEKPKQSDLPPSSKITFPSGTQIYLDQENQIDSLCFQRLDFE
jgi:hypothetical protein